MTKEKKEEKDKLQEFANKHPILYLLIVIYILILLTLLNINVFYSLAGIFLPLAIGFYIYLWKKDFKLDILGFKIDKKKTIIISITILLLALISLIIGIVSNIKPKPKIEDYYNDSIEKYDVQIDIDFEENWFFDKYNVNLKLYDIEETLYHGSTKTLNYKLPKGKHKLEFSGEGNYTSVQLKVDGDTYVKYKIKSHNDSIEVTEKEWKTIIPETTTTTVEIIKQIVMSKSENDYLNKNYKAVVEEFKNLGFENINTEAKETYDKNNTNEAIIEISINSKKIEADSSFKSKDEVKIIYWSVKETTTTTTTTTTTKKTSALDTFRSSDGNILAYIQKSSPYTYRIIDLNNKVVYFFEGGRYGHYKGTIISGDLNTVLVVKYKYNGGTYREGIHYRYVNNPDNLVVQDGKTGEEYDFKPTNLEDAQALLNETTLME